MPKVLVKTALFAFLVLVVQIHAIIPSQQALDLTHAYIRDGEEATIIQRPYLVDGKNYYVIYFHPASDPTIRNTVAVVDADNGVLVEDETTLVKVYSFDSKLTFLNEFLSENKLSFAELKRALDSGESSRQQAQTSLEQVDSNLAKIDETITAIQVAHSQFTVQIEKLKEEVDYGVETQDLFDQEYSSQTLNTIVTRYNTTFKTLFTTVKNGEDYQKAIINKSNELTQKGIDQNQFKPGLQTAFLIGLDKLPTSSALQNALNNFGIINSQQTQNRINDSIRSYLYRKQKTDSDEAVNGIKATTEEIIRRKSELVECIAVTPEVGKLEKNWQDVLSAQQANQFSAVIANVTLTQTQLSKVKREIDKCNTTVAPTQPQKSDNTNLYIGLVLILIVGYFALKMLSKKKPDEPTAMQEPTKQNLFG